MVKALALSRHAAPLGNVGQFRSRGICPVCLEGDRQSGRDQYVRRRWSRSETVACPIHRVCLRFSCMKCFTRYDFRFEYREGLAELICSGGLAPVACAADTLFKVRHADLLIATMEATDDAEKGRAG
ncbi:TniQ family protein [Agrobacterium deltaense]|uniref:TniQ family protein n=1 Tax=Agrobacterium deltaense TaxID=1183412 RepID=UPI003D9754EB